VDRTGPLTLARMRADVAKLISEAPEDVRDDDNLMDLGLDSMRVLGLVMAWGEDGIEYFTNVYMNRAKYVVMFISRPYDESLLVSGGDLAGELSIRGITRPKTLQVAPSTCARPARDCDVVATGAVRRSDYDMDDWMMAVSDRVVFVLRARLKDAS
jgi:aryl carrier-like protein